jgi:hypothetical protein
MIMANLVIAGGFYLPEGTAFILGISDVAMDDHGEFSYCGRILSS